MVLLFQRTVNGSPKFLWTFLDSNFKLWPNGSTSWKVRRSPKSVAFILCAKWISGPNSMADLIGFIQNQTCQLNGDIKVSKVIQALYISANQGYASFVRFIHTVSHQHFYTKYDNYTFHITCIWPNFSAVPPWCYSCKARYHCFRPLQPINILATIGTFCSCFCGNKSRYFQLEVRGFSSCVWRLKLTFWTIPQESFQLFCGIKSRYFEEQTGRVSSIVCGDESRDFWLDIGKARHGLFLTLTMWGFFGPNLTRS